MYIIWYISDLFQGLKMRSFGDYVIENDGFAKMRMGWMIVENYQ